MSDDDIERLLQKRSGRGTVRGAEQVWASARNEVDRSTPDVGAARFGGRPLFLAAAAVIAVALGGALLLQGGGAQTSTDAADDGSTGDEAPVLEVATDRDGSSDRDDPPAADEVGEMPDDGDGSVADEPTGGAVGDTDVGSTGENPDGGTEVDPAGDGATDREAGSSSDGGDEQGVDDDGGAASPSDPEEESPETGSAPAIGVETVTLGSWGPIRSSDPISVDGGWRIGVTPLPGEGASAGVVVRTAEPTRAVEGRLVIEVDFASTPQGRDPSSFGEIVVTPRSAPVVEDGFYLNEAFVGDPAFGCRLQIDRVAVCDLVGPDGEQVWEINFFTEVGEAQPAVTGGGSWLRCNSADVDRCLDTFRIELSQSEVRLLVNGEVHLHQTGLPSIPGSFFDRPVHVHLGGTVIRHPGGTETFRWGPLSLG